MSQLTGAQRLEMNKYARLAAAIHANPWKEGILAYEEEVRNGGVSTALANVKRNYERVDKLIKVSRFV